MARNFIAPALLALFAYDNLNKKNREARMDSRDALRRTASALKSDGPPFALAGSFALWAHGAPEPTHDVDFVVAESDVEAAAVY